MTRVDPVKQAIIRNELIAHAKAGSFPFYGQLGSPLGIHPRWPLWKLYLDAISSAELARKSPDITWIVRNSRTKLPGQMDFQQVTKPTRAHWRRAEGKAQEVIDCYCPGAKNPYKR